MIPAEYGTAWRLVLDTARLQPEADPFEVSGGITTSAGSVVVMQATESS
jgi:hypothetical protein